MKIVHLIWSFNTGGAETMLIDIANEQAKGHNVTIVIVNDSFQETLINNISDEVNVIFIKRPSKSRSLWHILKLNLTLHNLHPDILHLHNSSLPKILFSRHGSKVFMTIHALQYPLDAVKNGTRLIAISDAVKKDVLKRGNYEIVTIPNGINTSSISKRGSSCFNGKMRIVQVARLDAPLKGQDILIEAIAILKQRGSACVEVDFIGTGESEEYLQGLSKEKGVDDVIHFLGLRDRNYIYSHLKNYDLMCHPARYEGFGLTVAEGIAAMLPVLVSDDGGPYEIIGRGKYGSSFKKEDAVDCANKIENIYNHYEEALNKTEDAYRYILQNYSIENMVNSYIEYYKNSFNG